MLHFRAEQMQTKAFTQLRSEFSSTVGGLKVVQDYIDMTDCKAVHPEC